MRFAATLRWVVASSANSYGYTLTIWATSAVVLHHRGIPTEGDALAFVVGVFGGIHGIGGGSLLSPIMVGRGLPVSLSEVKSRLPQLIEDIKDLLEEQQELKVLPVLQAVQESQDRLEQRA